ncbi:substrate-binding domain-containing protein [Heliorestis convoluta]|uniref:Tungsten ABC transporter substrate-binding protein n=1 Tax=Heliorestis convoluta TaxID=356322 RepID=A0A5Q2MWY6_9FIRM|nr:substrate-binding domain-containing protein [Heliorestis convoluta]QGG46251.1 tungsten ABC transporter substrate-binding protein [Heliorestis convoluta]
MKHGKVKKFLPILLILALFVTLTGCGTTNQEGKTEDIKENLILATTTSTQDSGLLDALLPVFMEEHGYFVKTIAVGTGQALAMGEKGDADVLLTHAPEAERKLYDKGDILNYRLVMHNDFVIVGSSDDEAAIKGLTTSAEAFKKIAEAEKLFVSRADDSGTHKKELAIWEKASMEPRGSWYIETGSGMGPTLNVASEKSGYTLTDRGTYLALKDNLHLEILLEGEKDLLNIYHVAQVNPEKSSLINAEGAKAFVEFMVSEKAQQIIADFGVDKYGSPLFFPDAHRDPAEYGLTY